jgi:hypothetical protein
MAYEFADFVLWGDDHEAVEDELELPEALQSDGRLGSGVPQPKRWLGAAVD